MLCLDITGAFNRVVHRRLLYYLKKRRIPEDLIGFVELFLTERKTTIRFGSYESQAFGIEVGIPQGSVLSPILFLAFAADLLEVSQDSTRGVSSVGFVDDTHIITYGYSTAANCRKLAAAYDRCLGWARKAGAEFAPKKYELIHFAKGKQHGKGANLTIGEVTIEPVQSARILGVQIDAKLNWKEQLKKIKTKAESQTRALTRLTASTWGASFHRSRMIYKQVVLPGLTYGAARWKEPAEGGDRQKLLISCLERIQNKCLRAITGAYKATPVEMLHNEAQIMPVRIIVKRLVLKSSERGEASPARQVIKQACAKIREKLWSGRRRRAPNALTRSDRVAGWVKREKTRAAGAERGGDWTLNWARNRGKAEWEAYREGRKGQDYPALDTMKKGQLLEIHGVLKKAESSLLTQIRTGRIGLKGFLNKSRVPGLDSPMCECGTAEQTVQHVLNCDVLDTNRNELIRTEGSTDLKVLLRTKKGTKALLRWWMRAGIQEQFGLAAKLLGVFEEEEQEESRREE